MDLAHRIVRLEPGETKNGEARHFVMYPICIHRLRRKGPSAMRNIPVAPGIFQIRYRQQIRDFREAWAAACVATELADAQGEPTRIFRDLRRTGVRNLVRSGVPESVAMRISGHKTRSVFDRYHSNQVIETLWMLPQS